MSKANSDTAAPRYPAGIRDILPVTLIFAFLFAISFLPSDTSLSAVEKQQRLSVCVPSAYPPLVTGNSDRPGFSIELLQAITDRLNWRLNLVTNSAMGRDFNPRSWHINRAQCQMLAGGIAINETTQSFLDTSAPLLITGWAFAAAPGVDFNEIESPVGFFAGLAGLDRIALGQFLRQRGLSATIVDDADALLEGLRDGRFSAVITEALLARSTVDGTAFTVSLLPAPLERFPLGFGFWKGDLTLKREIEATLAALEAEGVVVQLANSYGIGADLVQSGSATQD